MSSVKPRSTDYHDVEEALSDLCNGMLEADALRTAFHTVQPDEMPARFVELLVHHDHMTTKLKGYYGRPVELHVLADRLDGDLYRRKIVLKPSGSNTIVEFGVVRIDLGFTPDAVRDEILAGETPLGDILIKHDVLRRIDPRWYLRLSDRGPLQSSPPELAEGDIYGRVGTIYCNDEPAIELLEVVTAQKPSG